jgi:hypothetical protein
MVMDRSTLGHNLRPLERDCAAQSCKLAAVTIGASVYVEP